MSDSSITQRILVPLDGSDLATVAIPYLRAVITPGSEIVLLRVAPETYPTAFMYGASAEYFHETVSANLEAASAYVQAVANELVDICPRISVLARSGFAPDQILQTAEDQNVDLIILATRGHGAVGRALLGSVADRVARASSVPVMLVRPQTLEFPPTADTKAEIRRIVVPLDGSDRARTALGVAANLARQLSVPVTFVRVLPSRYDMFASRDVARTTAVYERMVFATSLVTVPDRESRYYEEYCTAAKDALDAEASRLRATGIDADSDILIGPTGPTIVNFLMSGDLVVMTSHGEGGIRRWQIGSVAEKLVHEAAAPVLLVPNPERDSIS